MHHLSLNIDHIITGCHNYEPTMQEALYKHCYPAMMAVCMRYVENRDDAAAIYNEAMLKVLQNIQQYEYKGAFIGWVQRIIVNTCIDNCRKKVKYSIRPIDENTDIQYYIQNDFEENISSEEVVQLIQQLPPSTALVFNLYCMEGFKFDEIAEKLSITEGTAKWHVNEARKALRNKLQHFITKKTKANG
jgi:RNA polymerase sigma-70 factor, ECF subfamily